jgi:hypothetical protein
MKPEIGHIYKHYKGKHYKILTCCKHSETGEELVVYERQEDGNRYARPLNMFWEEVEFDGQKVPRFVLVK